MAKIKRNGRQQLPARRNAVGTWDVPWTVSMESKPTVSLSGMCLEWRWAFFPADSRVGFAGNSSFRVAIARVTMPSSRATKLPAADAKHVPYLFSPLVVRAKGVRTSVRREVGKRRDLEISKSRYAVPVFLRDKSRAPGPLRVCVPNTHTVPSGERLKERGQLL